MWPFKEQPSEPIPSSVRFIPMKSKEERMLHGLITQFGEFQYADKHIAASMLKIIAETCERMAKDENTFIHQLSDCVKAWRDAMDTKESHSDQAVDQMNTGRDKMINNILEFLKRNDVTYDRLTKIHDAIITGNTNT